MFSIEAYNIFHLSGNHHASSDGGIPLPVLSTTYALVFTGSDTEVHWKLVTIILEKISSAENSVQWENDWGVQEYPCNYSITQAWQLKKLKKIVVDRYSSQISTMQYHQRKNIYFWHSIHIEFDV